MRDVLPDHPAHSTCEVSIVVGFISGCTGKRKSCLCNHWMSITQFGSEWVHHPSPSSQSSPPMMFVEPCPLSRLNSTFHIAIAIVITLISWKSPTTGVDDSIAYFWRIWIYSGQEWFASALRLCGQAVVHIVRVCCLLYRIHHHLHRNTARRVDWRFRLCMLHHNRCRFHRRPHPLLEGIGIQVVAIKIIVNIAFAGVAIVHRGV